MKLRLFVLLAGLTVMTAAAQAQIGVYFAPTFTRVSNSTPDPGVFAFLGQNKTSQVFSGIGFGAFDQFAHTPLLDAGVDLRVNIQKGANAHLNDFLLGARVAFHPFVMPLKPYVEVLGGVGGTRAATNPIYQNRATYEGLAGVEYKLAKHIDWRVVEVGYQSLSTINTPAVTKVTASSLPGASTLLNFSTGFVFTIPQHLIP
jgi:hypothetical protein